MPSMPWPIIGLTGRAGAGKDTAGAVLAAHYGASRVAFADGVREALLALDPTIVLASGIETTVRQHVEMHGWDVAKRHHEIRRLLQVLGTEVGRDILGPMVWIRRLFRVVPPGPLVITDVRYDNEAATIRYYGGVVVEIVRPGDGLDGDNAHHTSERGISRGLVTATVHNPGDVDAFRARLIGVIEHAADRR